jgi:hypothetical protein
MFRVFTTRAPWRRTIGVFLALTAAPGAGLGCGSSLGPARPVGGPAVGPPTRFEGVVGGRAFVARSAVMLPPVRWTDGTTIQELLVFDREVDCAEADAIERVQRRLAPGEYLISVEMKASWPAYPGGVWISAPGVTGDAEMWLMGRGENGSPTGYAARGEMKVLAASPGAGHVSLRLAAEPSDPFYRDIPPASMEGRLWGSASGEVSFIVCRR